MTKGLIFWILMLLWLVFGVWSHWGGGDWRPLAAPSLLFILLLLLGWEVFGPPVK